VDVVVSYLPKPTVTIQDCSDNYAQDKVKRCSPRSRLRSAVASNTRTSASDSYVPPGGWLRQQGPKHSRRAVRWLCHGRLRDCLFPNEQRFQDLCLGLETVQPPFVQCGFPPKGRAARGAVWHGFEASDPLPLDACIGATTLFYLVFAFWQRFVGAILPDGECLAAEEPRGLQDRDAVLI
jgi:hypothetical protein